MKFTFFPWPLFIPISFTNIAVNCRLFLQRIASNLSYHLGHRPSVTKEHTPGAVSKENTSETIRQIKCGWQNHWAPGFSCPLPTEQALPWSSLSQIYYPRLHEGYWPRDGSSHKYNCRERLLIDKADKLRLQNSLIFFKVKSWASQVVLVVENPPTNAGDLRDSGSIPRPGRCPGGGHGNPLQYPCLENPHGQRSLAGYHPWGRKELDTTERLSTAHRAIQFSSILRL